MLDQITYKGYTIEIDPDPYPEDPRNWDNLGTIITRRFWNECEWVDPNDRDAVMDRIATVEKQGGIVLPIYCYSHGIDRFRTRDFYDAGLPQGHARFDSGLAGFIYAELEKIRERFGVKRVTKAIREQATENLKGEVETIDAYSCGAVYGFTLKNPDGDEIDSCWGYYDKADMIAECQATVDHEMQKPANRQILLELLGA